MVFNDTSTKGGLLQDVEQNVFGNYGEITSNTNRLYDFTARLNRSLDKAVGKILGWDTAWSFDDTNNSDLPIGTTPLVSGQTNYSISVAHLEIEKVLILDSTGKTRTLRPVDLQDTKLIKYLENPTETGVPEYYDLKGNSLFLYPATNYAIAEGLIVHFKRGPSYFTYTDTTKAPGFASIFHRYVSLDASLDYAIAKQLPQVASLSVLVNNMEKDMERFYTKRSVEAQPRMTPAVENNK